MSERSKDTMSKDTISEQFTGASYPLPQGALYVWLAGHTLMIGIPPTEGHERGHTVLIPLEKCSLPEQPDASNIGWATLLQVLRERAQLVRGIGSASAPTQYDVDRVLKRAAREGAERDEGSRPRVRKFDSKGVEQIPYEDLDLEG